MDNSNNDQLINDFVNVIFDDDKGEYYSVKEGCFLGPNTMYEYEWDWLMTVVEEISNRGISGGITYELRDALICADIKKAYTQVIEIINLCNV